MSKTIDSLVQSSLDSKNFTGVILAKLYFSDDGSDVRRYCNAYQSVYWDEEGTGEKEYIGLGNLAGMSIIGETTDLSAQAVQLSLSGIPNSTITDIFSNNYIGKPAYIWYATLDPDTYAVQYASPNNAEDGPILIFAGRMDFGNMEFGETATITVNITNRLADWDRPRGGRFNQAYQTRHVDPTDKGFDYIMAIQGKNISWGGRSLSDPGGPTAGPNFIPTPPPEYDDPGG